MAAKASNTARTLTSRALRTLKESSARAPATEITANSWWDAPRSARTILGRVSRVGGVRRGCRRDARVGGACRARGRDGVDTRPEVLENEREADGGDHDRQERDDRQGLLPSLHQSGFGGDHLQQHPLIERDPRRSLLICDVRPEEVGSGSRNPCGLRRRDGQDSPRRSAARRCSSPSPSRPRRPVRHSVGTTFRIWRCIRSPFMSCA